MESNSLSTTAYLPTITEGETLYSWVGHYHRLSGHACAYRTSLQLFNHKFDGMRWIFPYHLDHFDLATGGLLGDATSLIFERSLLGYFAPFYPKKVIQDAVENMKSNTCKSLIHFLGIKGSPFGGYIPLKACPDCIKKDLQQHHISKWHLEHQWPSTFICRKHNKLLRVVKRGSARLNAPSNIFLPQDIDEMEWEASTEIPPQTMKALEKVVDFSTAFAHCRGFHFDHNLLRHTYLLGAKKHGWLNVNETINRNIEGAFYDRYIGIEKLPLFHRAKFGKNNQRFISVLFSNSENHYHPMRHYLLMAFLFESPEEFNTTYEKVSAAFKEGGISRMNKLLSNDWRTEIPRLIEVEKLSIKKAAKALNINYWLVTHFLKNKIKTYRNFSRYDKYSDQFLSLINEGLTGAEISRRMNISRSTLKYYFQSRAPLREAWEQKKLEKSNRVFMSKHHSSSEISNEILSHSIN